MKLSPIFSHPYSHHIQCHLSTSDKFPERLSPGYCCQKNPQHHWRNTQSHCAQEVWQMGPLVHIPQPLRHWGQVPRWDTKIRQYPHYVILFRISATKTSSTQQRSRNSSTESQSHHIGCICILQDDLLVPVSSLLKSDCSPLMLRYSGSTIYNFSIGYGSDLAQSHYFWAQTFALLRSCAFVPFRTSS